MVELLVNMSQSKMFESPSTAPFDVFSSIVYKMYILYIMNVYKQYKILAFLETNN